VSGGYFRHSPLSISIDIAEEMFYQSMGGTIFGNLEIFRYTWGHENLLACKKRKTIDFF